MNLCHRIEFFEKADLKFFNAGLCKLSYDFSPTEKVRPPAFIELTAAPPPPPSL